jgi:outer membrane protein
MKKIVLLVFLFLFSGSIYAQPVVDLNTAIKTALQNNPDIIAQQNNLTIQSYNIKNVQGDLFPSLNVTGGWSRNNTFSKGGIVYQNGIPIFIGDQSRTQDNVSVGISSQVTLFNGFANYENITLEKQNETSIKLNLEKLKYDIVINVYSRYFDVLKKERIVVANEETLNSSIAQLNKIKEYVNVGKKTMSDVYKQDVQVAQDELTLEQSRNDLKKAKVELLYAMYDDVNKEIQVNTEEVYINYTLKELAEMLTYYRDIESLTKKAVANRYDYKIALKQIEINQIKLSIAKKNLYFPSLTAFSNYNLNGDRFDKLTNTRAFTFGLSLSYPIFQGFNQEVNRQIAEVNVKQKSEDLKKLELQIKSEIKKAVLDLEAAYKQLEILERNIASAEQDKILSEENFLVGYGTILDVQVATTKLNNLKINRINAIYNFILAKKQIEYLIGQLKF